MFYFTKIPNVVSWLFPGVIIRKKSEKKCVHLTFDDGPTPYVTPWVLDLLERYNAKATFFCLGKQVESYPKVFEEIVERGHTVGNHSFSHLNGWKTGYEKYITDVERASELIKSDLFRPPYGRLSWKQYCLLKKKFRIVLWDVTAGDFDPKVSAEQLCKNVLERAAGGSVVLLHDSEKCADKLKESLPRILEDFSQRGYRFESL